MSQVLETHDKDTHSYVFLSNDEKPIARITIDNVHEERSMVHGEVSIHYLLEGENQPIVRYKRLNLTTNKRPGVDELASVIPTYADIVDSWYETAVSTTIEAYRKPIKAVDLQVHDTISANSGFLIDPLILGRGVSLLFAQGGTGKSFIALAMCVAVASGEQILNLEASETGPCLYIDYEDDIETHELRLGAILKGAGMAMTDLEHPIKYIRPTQSLFKMQRQVNGVIREIKPRLIIVDSVALARGGDANTSEDTIRAFATMHQFDTSVLALDHVTKEDVRGKKVITPYGSVYTINSVRLAWGMTAKDSSDDTNTYVDLIQTKRNNVARHDAMLFHLKFVNIQMEVGELGSMQPVLAKVEFIRRDGWMEPIPQAKKEVTSIDKAITYLAKHPPLTTRELATKLRLKNHTSLGSALGREARRGDPRIMKIPGGRAAKWTATTLAQQQQIEVPPEEGKSSDTKGS